VLFAPYAKKQATFQIEDIFFGPAESVAATILWMDVTFGGQKDLSIQRMSVMLAREAEGWTIFFMQVTPVVAK
jgi:hypothetical protein